MKKTTFVALLLLSSQCVADSFGNALQAIESEWAAIYYKTPKTRQGVAYQQLLEKTTQLRKQHPSAAEPIFWEAVIKATSADSHGALSALSLINEAKELLQKAISINPHAMDGSAYVTLGTLYYMVPKWPIAFGDNDKAKTLLETALKINPTGIDSNYYYGDFLVSQNQSEEAKKYFENAINAPARPEQAFADSQLKTEAQKALDKIKEAEAGKKIIASFGYAASVRY
jgi:tetratricopeptide (TPR) repeat protein